MPTSITIYHRSDSSMFFEFSVAREFGDTPALENKYTYDMETEGLDVNETLAQVFTDNNNGMVPAVTLPNGVRSLSVGDVAVFNETPFEVLMAGWAHLRLEELIDAIEAGSTVNSR